MHFPNCVTFFYYLPWLSKTKVSYKNLQRNGVNTCGNRMCKLSLKDVPKFNFMMNATSSQIVNETSSHWSDSFGVTERSSLIILEFSETPILLLAIVGMYNGIEIRDDLIHKTPNHNSRVWLFRIVKLMFIYSCIVVSAPKEIFIPQGLSLN